MSEFILLSRPRPRVLLMTFNRPARRNALSVAMMVEIAGALTDAASDDDIRCVVMTGDDKAFSAGADIKDQDARGAGAALAPEKVAAWETVDRFPKPLLAAVNGYALGGGLELAMACDIIIAGDGATFGQPEINLGIHPGDGATQRLPRTIGKSLAMRLILSGQFIGAEEARAAGLVAEVAPAGETVERTLDLAAVIAEKSPVALRLAKASVLQAYESPLTEGLRLEQRSLARAFESEDQKEGARAFVEKRPPRFVGR